MVAEVIINRTAKKLNRTFDYGVPKEMEHLITVGSKVIVPFGKKETLEEAHIIKIKQKSEYQIKDIIKVETELTDKQIELAKWMAKKYYCTLSDCIKLMQTPGTKSKKQENKIQDKKINTIYLKKEIEEINIDIKTRKIKSEKQIKILNYIKKNEGSTIPEIEKNTQCSRAIINTLIKKEYLQIIQKNIERNPLINKKVEKTQDLQLTKEQKNAYEQICDSLDKNEYKQYLLYGVTGSGKTEIYLQIIQKILQNNKTAIVLVPEISLTPQMLDRFIRKIW